jgi:hypothetical protein
MLIDDCNNYDLGLGPLMMYLSFAFVLSSITIILLFLYLCLCDLCTLLLMHCILYFVLTASAHFAGSSDGFNNDFYAMKG